MDEVLEDFHGQYAPLGDYFFCVQFISSKKLRITFNSATLMEDCLSAGLSLRGFPLEPQPISTKKWVSVQRLAIGIPAEAATRILGKFGKVFAAKHEIKRGIYTGTLSILMDVQRNIPSALRIRGHTCLIFYRGQTRTCFRCQSPDHTTRDCPDLRHHTSAPGEDAPPTDTGETRDHPTSSAETDPQETSAPVSDTTAPSPSANHTGQDDSQMDTHTSAPGEDAPPTDTGETRDHPTSSAETDSPPNSHPQETPAPGSDTTATSPSANHTGQDDSQMDTPSQTPSPVEEAETEGMQHEGTLSSPSQECTTDRTVETNATATSPSPDADDPDSSSTELTGLADDAAGETMETGTTNPTTNTSQSPTTSPSETVDQNALESTVVLEPPASYASAVDPNATTVTTTSETLPSAASPTTYLEDFPPCKSKPVTDKDTEGFKIPRRQRRPPARTSNRMRSRSRSASSSDSTSSSGPPTRKRTQPSLAGTGVPTRRTPREINITLGQFGALHDLVPDSGELPEIRLSASGNLLPDLEPNGNLRPRPTTETDSTLESLLQKK